MWFQPCLATVSLDGTGTCIPGEALLMTIDESGTGWLAAWRYNMDQEAAYRRRPSSGHKTLCHHHDHQLRTNLPTAYLRIMKVVGGLGIPATAGAMERKVKWR